MKIKGYLKSSFIDYPDKIASVIFLGGCNYRCPYCHNGELVHNDDCGLIDLDDIRAHIKKRKGIIDGVVVTGGEPTLSKGIVGFLEELRETGISVKLDTNGSRPEVLREIIGKGLVDYLAMDVKSSLEGYNKAIGHKTFDENTVMKSIKYIRDSGVPYEFRTTLVKELHPEIDIMGVGALLDGSDKLVLQQYNSSEKELTDNAFTYYTVEEMNLFKAKLEQDYSFDKVDVRGRF